ncbi:hypothetical protein E4U56_002174 [Claviceps arundinis]|uniref:Uncharacterized protein n=1 Tax=Claviceps arundinis TaxID=1623583 RepID=A0A9P7SN14_9HYPO|nr:hypothetical protein E4U56_002174 [Claviceps arundinis]
MAVQDFAKRFRGYVPLESATAERLVDRDEDTCAETAYSNGRWSRAFLVMSISNMVLFLLTASMMTSLGLRSQKRVLNAELRATSSYTPIYDMIDLEPSIRKINGTVMPAGKLSIARQFPNPAADAIWTEDIELIRPIPVTREQIIKMGKDPDTVAKLEDDDWGLGDDAYVAALDVFHNLHCLNSACEEVRAMIRRKHEASTWILGNRNLADQKHRLRKAAYATYYNRTLGSFEASFSIGASSRLKRRDKLTADDDQTGKSNNLNLVTRHWIEGLEYPFPDFSIQAHCINFEKLTEWHKEASIDINKYLRVMKKPPGVKERPTEVWHPEEWFERQN